MTCLVGNCLSFLQFLAKINLLKPQKLTFIGFTKFTCCPAALNCYNMSPDCSELNSRNMLSPQLPVPTFQTRLRLNNTDILAQPKSSPDIKGFQSSFISPLQKPYAKISNFYNQILTLTIKSSEINNSSQSQYPHSSQPFILL